MQYDMTYLLKVLVGGKFHACTIIGSGYVIGASQLPLLSHQR